ncbi:MAG: hypothetical protein ATN36_08940 [Epulopiscium sp. Nele67-Bin005]|nr:MAG: hypothetical protein ATN36_08940 [Epulopiscium sp. Nele67-Bin005]
MSKLKVVAIGGGTGLSTMLKGIKEYTQNITAIVTVSDNGGGSGILRQQMQIAPPGDIRNCLVSLANTEPMMKKLLQYRFEDGTLKGQNFGNIFLAALAEVSGSFENAVKYTSDILAISGRVLPVTLEDVDLYATFADGIEVIGETEIVTYGKINQIMIEKIVLTPQNPKPTPDVLEAIEEADIILIGPGSLYTSIIPNLLVEKVAEAITKSNAHKIYIANIMSQPGETTGFTIEQHIEALEKYLGKNSINSVIVNSRYIEPEYINKYAEEGAHLLKWNEDHSIWRNMERIEKPLAKVDNKKLYIRHDTYQLAKAIFSNTKG